MIKPIVNILKIIDNYDAVIVGFSGVLTEGQGLKSEALQALINIKKSEKKIVLLSNDSMRVETLALLLHQNKVPLSLFETIITAGEVLHYQLKSGAGNFGALGKKCYLLGAKDDKGIFFDLDYEVVDDVSKADFLMMTDVANITDTVETYQPELEYAASLNLPFVCAGNDTSTYKNGQFCLAPAAFAEQYAILGGNIITIGKPNIQMLQYALESLDNVEKDKILLIGDNMSTDIKGANLAGIHACLVSKGIHMTYLGEGYIPDVAKTRELSKNFDAFPDYVISSLRW